MPTTDPKAQPQPSPGDRKAASLPEVLERLSRQLDHLLPEVPQLDFERQWGFRWVRRQTVLGTHSYAQPIRHLAQMRLDDLQGIGPQADRVIQNTRQFVAGRPANNVLLTGARGTGKSSLVRACLGVFGDQGLRLIEVDRGDLVDLPLITELVAGRAQQFVVFCDDLSFEAGDPGYKALKTLLDGGLEAQAPNLLVYATSNRRHLMPESMADNVAAGRGPAGDIHPGETIDEKVSLSDRFGLWVPFHSFDQGGYLEVVHHWLGQLGAEVTESSDRAALQWATERGSRSGRVALAFAKDWAGRAAADSAV